MVIRYIDEELKQLGKDLVGLADCLKNAEKGELNDLYIDLEEIKDRLNAITN